MKVSLSFYKIPYINLSFRSSKAPHFDVQTVEYYNLNGAVQRGNEVLYNQTIRQRKNFLELLPENAENILDAGAGSGRDGSHFAHLKNKNGKKYNCTFFDASHTMCKLLEQKTGFKASCTSFEEFETDDKYDGIWARNSLLHVKRDEFSGVVEKLTLCLNDEGILFATIRAGDGESRDSKGRYFNYYSKDELNKILENIEGARLLYIKEYKDEVASDGSNTLEFALRKEAQA